MFQLPETGDEACRRSRKDALLALLPFSVAGECPLNAQQVVLSWQGKSPPVSVANGIGHPALLPRHPVARCWERLVRFTIRRGKYLPVHFEFKLVFIQPPLNDSFQLSQLSLVGTEDGQIIHVANVVVA